MLKLKLILLLCGLSLDVFSQGLLNVTSIGTMEMGFVPSFFFKVNNTGSLLAYSINNGGFPGANYLFDTAIKKTLGTISGPWDPVFTPDGNYMVIPYVEVGSIPIYKLFRLKDLQEFGVEAAPIYSFSKIFEGYYQSTGILFKNERQLTLRVIAEKSGGSHLKADITIDLETDKVVNESVSPLCSNFKIKLPMLSKNGLELGGLNAKTGLTEIFKINEDGRCDSIIQFKRKTGKVNFSFDGRFITYHFYYSNDKNLTDGYITFPPANVKSDIFVYDRATNIHLRLTANSSGNNLYPDFLESGYVVFGHYPANSSSMILQTISFSGLNISSWDDLTNSTLLSQNFLRTYVLENEKLKVLSVDDVLKHLKIFADNDLAYAFLLKAKDDGIDVFNQLSFFETMALDEDSFALKIAAILIEKGSAEFIQILKGRAENGEYKDEISQMLKVESK